MNTFFYLAIDRTDLGKSVAIEFIGPITVAAVMTRTARNAGALALAALGVVVLGGVELDGNAAGMVYLLAASACWAAYIVVGSRVAQQRPRHGRPRRRAGDRRPRPDPVRRARQRRRCGRRPACSLACLLVGVFSNAIAYGIDQHVLRAHPGAPVLGAARAAAGDRGDHRLARA